VRAQLTQIVIGALDAVPGLPSRGGATGLLGFQEIGSQK
jgi:hypothetical protein